LLKRLKIESATVYDIERLANTTQDNVLVPYLHTFQLSAQLCDVSLDIFAALHLLSSARCEGPFDPTHGVARLEILQVLPYRRFSPFNEGYRALEAWILRDSSRLQLLNDKLLSLCPEGDIGKDVEEREGLVSMSKRYTEDTKVNISDFWKELMHLQDQDPKELVVGLFLYRSIPS